MDTNKEYTSSAMAIRDFFGMKPGETISEFMEELKALTREDREELTRLLIKLDYKIMIVL